MNLRLAGFDLLPDAVNYLTKNLKLRNKIISFSLLKQSINNSDSADAIIFFKNVFV